MTLGRTQLATPGSIDTPGSSPEMVEKAAESDADEAFLDLEGLVAPGENIVVRARQANVL